MKQKASSVCLERETMAAHRVGEISASYTPDNPIGFKVYKKFKKGNTTNLNKLLKRQQGKRTKKFSEKEIRTVNKYMKNSRYLALSKIQIKTT